MGRIDDAIRTLESIQDETERALQLAGLISTLFRIKGVELVATNQLAFDGYANTISEKPEVELAAFTGSVTTRTILEIMRGTLRANGSLNRWMVAGIPVRFQHDSMITCRELCRDFTTNLGVIKFLPVEEMTADYILSATYPEPDADAHARAHLLLFRALADVFHMDWPMLHALCHRPDYRIGEELAQMRLAAKKDVDAMGAGRDHVGETSKLPSIIPPTEPVQPTVEQSPDPALA